MRFEDRIALITGGSRGIGLAAAQALAGEGARVALLARDPAAGQAAAAGMRGAQFIPGDVTRAADCQRAVAETVRQFGRLDVLVNCAGVIYRRRTVEQTSEEEWDHTFDTNVKGVFLMCKYALPELRKTQGCIVSVSSYVGLVGFAGAGAYAASKAAILNLTRSMALDHAAEGMRVNAVCPGSVETDMIHAAWAEYEDYEAARRMWMEKHPLGRIARPEEVARAILFLASSEASFITGAVLAVDGGLTAA